MFLGAGFGFAVDDEVVEEEDGEEHDDFVEPFLTGELRRVSPLEDRLCSGFSPA